MHSGLSRIAIAIGGLSVAALAFWVTLKILDYREADKIQIVEASYGLSCKARAGNVTENVSSACMGKSGTCSYLVETNKIGDPVPFCAKDFSVKWRCGSYEAVHELILSAEANGKEIDVSCPAK